MYEFAHDYIIKSNVVEFSFEQRSIQYIFELLMTTIDMIRLFNQIFYLFNHVALSFYFYDS